ncbi:MAG: Eco29kI family restriction endonuclease [Candidatus Acidiferrales bacterium]
MPDEPFDPLSKSVLAEGIANQLFKAEVHPLPPKTRFVGAGVYALYYSGKFAPYRKITSQANEGIPIYVGKAIPKGSRKGGVAKSGNALFSRLSKHSVSIGRASNLELRHFSCRYLVCDEAWITFCEAMLITRFQPLWNVFVLGFGINAPGGGRRGQKKSMWDTLHPGRPEAGNLPPNDKTVSQLKKMIVQFLEGKQQPIITPTEAVIEEDQESNELA